MRARARVLLCVCVCRSPPLPQWGLDVTGFDLLFMAIESVVYLGMTILIEKLRCARSVWRAPRARSIRGSCSQRPCFSAVCCGRIALLSAHRASLAHSPSAFALLLHCSTIEDFVRLFKADPAVVDKPEPIDPDVEDEIRRIQSGAANSVRPMSACLALLLELPPPSWRLDLSLLVAARSVR